MPRIEEVTQGGDSNLTSDISGEESLGTAQSMLIQ